MKPASNRRGRLPAAPILVCVALCAAAAAFADDDWEKVTETSHEDVAIGRTVRIANPHGNVYTRFGGYEPRVELLATIQRLDDRSLPALELHRERNDAGDLVVAARFGEADVADGRRDRVDVVVFLPVGVHVDIETDDGSAEVKKVKSDVRFRSRTGDLIARGIVGHVEASSDRGKLQVFLESGATERAQTFTTVTGEIEITLWEDAAYTATMATSGEISTDFSVTFEYRKFEEPGKIARAAINGGGPELRLQTRRGPLRLYRQQRDFTPEAKR